MDRIPQLSKLSSGAKKLFSSSTSVVFLVTLCIATIVHLTTGNFYTPYNILTFTRTVSFTIIIAFAQTLVLLLGGIDLSIASIAALCSWMVAHLSTATSCPPFLAVIISVCFGLVLGFINGVFIVGLKLTPFIVTLATSSLYRGVVYVVTKGHPITGIPEEITIIGQGSLGMIPYPFILMLVIWLILLVVLHKTTLGRQIYAVGDNEQAARIVGIKTNKVKMFSYMIAGLLSAVAGVVMVLRLGAAQVNIGENWVMPSITAAVIGGVSMTGGIGNITGAIIGGLLMGVISFSINLLGISSFWEQIVTGSVVLVAVSIDVIRTIKISRNKA